MANVLHVSWKYGRGPNHENDLYEADSIDEWLKLCNEHEGELMSPGGIAQKFGVSRATVNNWVFRDHKVTSFVYRKPPHGTYTLVDVSTAEVASQYTRKASKTVSAKKLGKEK